MRIAVFGGSFNPVHNGHLKLAEAVRELAGYDRILFVPAYHSPFKALPSGATDDDRVRMLELALAGKDWAVIEKCEISRGGMSYTYDTIEYLERKYTASGEFDKKRDGKLGLVIGTDLVAGFEKWYRAEELAAKVDIILARRTVTETPDSGEGCDNPYEAAAPKNVATLPFAHIELQNPYVDVSSSEIRDAVLEAAGSTKAAGDGAEPARNAKKAYGNTAGRAKGAKSSKDTKKSATRRKKLLALVPESVCDYILERRLYE